MSIHLQRRPHTRKATTLPQIDEESDEIPTQRSKRRPRPTPIVTPFQMQPIDFDILKSTQTLTFLDKDAAFSLSPSLLLTRRKSETVLDFPVPPKNATQAAFSALDSPPRYSPTPSGSSVSSASSYPVTPVVSDSEEERCSENDDIPATSPSTPCSVRRQPYRTPSALSLKSFGVSEFDAQAASIYALLRTSPASPPPSAPLPKRPELRQEVEALRNLTSMESFIGDWVDVDSESIRIPREPSDVVKRRPSFILSVADDPTEELFEIPFVVDRNFLDIDLSDEDGEESEDNYLLDVLGLEVDESHITGLTVFTMSGGFASSDEESDDEHRRPSIPSPSRVQDPDIARQASRRGAIAQPQLLFTPSKSSITSSSSPSSLSVATPSPVPSTKSSFLSRLAIPPRESIVPRDVDMDDLFSPIEDIQLSIPALQFQNRSPSPKPIPPPKRGQSLTQPVMFTSPFTSSSLLGYESNGDADDDDCDERPLLPVLRSRFSTSTLNSVPEQPQSPKLALASPSKFFSRLLGSPSPPSRRAPPPPPKVPVRNLTQPLKYRKSPHTSQGPIALRPPKSLPSPPGRRPSKSLELYDRPPVTPTCSSPIPFDKERTERYYNYYQKHRPDQRILSTTTKRFPSRSSLDTTYSMESILSGSGESSLSAGSASSAGLKRRPIPVELFIKH